ncbi:MAG: trigger factor [Actinobacteria bacterium]|nr:trigger factor [Actinomycetota bacterium]
MKVVQRNVGDNKVRLVVTVPAEEMAKHITEMYKLMAQQARIQPVEGKMPKDVLIERIGAENVQKGLDTYVMNNLAPFAISEKEVEIIGTPSFFSEYSVEEGKDFEFSMVMLAKPSFKLSSYEPVEITLPPFSINDEVITNRMTEEVEKTARMEKDESREDVRENDFVNIALETREGDTILPGLTHDGRMYQANQGYMPEAFDENLIGMKVGETKTFDFEAPTFEFDEEGNPLMGTYSVTVTVNEISKNVIPALSDAWVKENIPGSETVPEFEAKVREGVIEQGKKEYDQYKEYLCASALAKRLEGKIPDEFYEATFKDLNQNFELQLSQQGMTKEQFFEQQGLNDQQFMMTMMFQAKEQLSQNFALDALAKHLKLEVTDEDYDKLFSLMAPGQEAMAKKEMERSGRMFAMKEAALRMKASQWLSDNAIAKEATPVEATPAEATAEEAAPAE